MIFAARINALHMSLFLQRTLLRFRCVLVDGVREIRETHPAPEDLSDTWGRGRCK